MQSRGPTSNAPDIVGILKNRRISWAEHVWWAKGQTLRETTIWRPDGKRPRGRPRRRWIDRVGEDLKLLGIRDGEQLAKDQKAWRCVVEAANIQTTYTVIGYYFITISRSCVFCEMLRMASSSIPQVIVNIINIIIHS